MRQTSVLAKEVGTAHQFDILRLNDRILNAFDAFTRLFSYSDEERRRNGLAKTRLF